MIKMTMDKSFGTSERHFGVVSPCYSFCPFFVRGHQHDFQQFFTQGISNVLPWGNSAYIDVHLDWLWPRTWFCFVKTAAYLTSQDENVHNGVPKVFIKSVWFEHDIYQKLRGVLCIMRRTCITQNVNFVLLFIRNPAVYFRSSFEITEL